MNTDPQIEYHQRLEESDRRAKQLEARSLLLANARLVTFGGASVLAWWFYAGMAPAAWGAGGLLAVFLGLVVTHARTDQRLEQEQRRIAYYQEGLNRLTDQWIGNGRGGEAFCPANHLSAGDLDLFGRGSLFERLNTTCTEKGEARLVAAPARRAKHPAGTPGGRGRTLQRARSAGTTGHGRSSSRALPVRDTADHLGRKGRRSLGETVPGRRGPRHYRAPGNPWSLAWRNGGGNASGPDRSVRLGCSSSYPVISREGVFGGRWSWTGFAGLAPLAGGP